MKLVEVYIENFRGYAETARVRFDELTTIVGKNDAGKSTVLEALEIFLNEGKPERGDASVYSQSTSIRIGCTFTNLPSAIVLDTAAKTTLADEYLLNDAGNLEILKEWNVSSNTVKETVFAIALHPTNVDANDLLSLMNRDLKARLKKLKIDEKVANLSVNSSIRSAIRNALAPLELKPSRIQLDKQDAKKVWEQIKPQLPLFALFRSDRPSQDGDDEVQSPLKFAVTQALKEVEPDLKKIEDHVRTRATDVANRTLKKLSEMDAHLATELKPDFKTDPKWDVFKFSLTGDNDIPINKRGSGVRRLILLNFFRAEAERRREELGGLSIIYAIEEPETSQHPDNQKLLVQALREITSSENTQVILTTHTPGLAGLLPSDSLWYVRKLADGTAVVSKCQDDDLPKIAIELGVVPDRRVQILLLVEGPHDVACLERFSSIIRSKRVDAVDLTSDDRIAVLPVGGTNLKQWVAKHYLKNLSLPEVHIYDRDEAIPPKYQSECDQVNLRTDGSWATLTSKRELENYLHPDAISEARPSVMITVTNSCDVPALVAEAVHVASGSDKSWSEVVEDKDEFKKKTGRAKRWLNSDAASKMNYERLLQMDPDKEIESWFTKIYSMLR